jgi:hypothetical protein
MITVKYFKDVYLYIVNINLWLGLQNYYLWILCHNDIFELVQVSPLEF